MKDGRTFKRKDAEPQSFWNKETDVSDLSEINRTNYAVPAIRKIRQIRSPLSFFDHKMHGRNESFVFFSCLLCSKKLCVFASLRLRKYNFLESRRAQKG